MKRNGQMASLTSTLNDLLLLLKTYRPKSDKNAAGIDSVTLGWPSLLLMCSNPQRS